MYSNCQLARAVSPARPLPSFTDPIPSFPTSKTPVDCIGVTGFKIRPPRPNHEPESPSFRLACWHHLALHYYYSFTRHTRTPHSPRLCRCCLLPYLPPFTSFPFISLLAVLDRNHPRTSTSKAQPSSFFPPPIADTALAHRSGPSLKPFTDTSTYDLSLHDLTHDTFYAR
jgi:hypothetical protein